MKKLTLTTAAIALTLGTASIGRAADATAPSAMPDPAYNAPAAANPAAAQAAPSNWTDLQGTVQAVDATSKTLQIKDDAGQLIQVPVDRQVSIQKDGKNVKLTQIKTGDIVILARKPGSSSGSKTY